MKFERNGVKNELILIWRFYRYLSSTYYMMILFLKRNG